MPTIHIHIDHDDTLAVVAVLLNEGYRITVDLDEVPTAEPVPTKRVPTPTIVERIEASTKRLSDDERQRRRDQEYNAAFEVRAKAPCPKCKAKIDYPCVDPHGHPYGAFVHVDRRLAAFTKAGA